MRLDTYLQRYCCLALEMFNDTSRIANIKVRLVYTSNKANMHGVLVQPTQGCELVIKVLRYKNEKGGGWWKDRKYQPIKQIKQILLAPWHFIKCFRTWLFGESLCWK